MYTDKEKDRIVFGAIANFLGQPQGGCVTKPKGWPALSEHPGAKVCIQTRDDPNAEPAIGPERAGLPWGKRVLEFIPTPTGLRHA